MLNTQFPDFIFFAGVLEREILLVRSDTHVHTHTHSHAHHFLFLFQGSVDSPGWSDRELDRQEEL